MQPALNCLVAILQGVDQAMNEASSAKLKEISVFNTTLTSQPQIARFGQLGSVANAFNRKRQDSCRAATGFS